VVNLMKWLTLGALAVCLSACADGRQGILGATAVRLSSGDLPPPSTADVAVRQYQVGPLDQLDVDVYGIEALSKREIVVDAAGRFSFPLIGDVAAAGKTPSQIQNEIAARLREKHVRDPQVSVNVRETRSQVVTIDGEVKEPGIYPVLGRMTLMRAVASAKGVSEVARLDDVVVFRTVRGQRMAALYNLRAIRNGMYADPEIFPNDIVMVGDSPARRIFKDVIQVAPVLSYVVVALL